MNITYENWAKGDKILAHVITVPETSTTEKAEISIGINLELQDLTVVVETTLVTEGVTSDLGMTRLTEPSDFEYRPRAHYARREKANLHEAIIECDTLKAAFEFKIFQLVDEDRKAFERSLSGA